MAQRRNDKVISSPPRRLCHSLLSWLTCQLIPTMKLAFYTLLTTERDDDTLHKVRLFHFGIPLVMKKTLRTISTEADALSFLNNANPNLPIPRLLDSFILGEATYTIMTKLPGENLLDQPMSASQLRVVAEEVVVLLEELWKIPQPACFAGQVMCSASGHGLPNPMTLHMNLASTFSSTLDCYAMMNFKDMGHFMAETDPTALEKLAADSICWVHTDLRLQNILVKDGHLSGVVDWEDSGWLPRHWQLHMFRNVYMHGMTFEWWRFWKDRKIDSVAEEAYEISLGLITYPL